MLREASLVLFLLYVAEATCLSQTQAVCQHLLYFCQWGICSHTINHPKHIHIHVLGMYLMKGWSAAFVTKQVCIRGVTDHRARVSLCGAKWAKLQQTAVMTSVSAAAV